MVNRSNVTRANGHRVNGIRADVVAPTQTFNLSMQTNEHDLIGSEAKKDIST